MCKKQLLTLMVFIFSILSLQGQAQGRTLSFNFGWKFHHGFAMAVLRSVKESGEVKLTVRSEGLKKAEIALKTNKY